MHAYGQCGKETEQRESDEIERSVKNKKQNTEKIQQRLEQKRPRKSEVTKIRTGEPKDRAEFFVIRYTTREECPGTNVPCEQN